MKKIPLEPDKKTLDRRDFGKAAAAGGAACILVGAGAFAEEPSSEAKVALAGAPRGADDNAVMEAVRAAALEATDFSWLGKGDSVYIKVVINSGNPYPATTSPAGLRAMVKLLKDRGAGRVIVSDMSGIEHVKLSEKGMERGSSRKLLESAGLFTAALESGAEVYFPEEDGWDAWFEDELKEGAHWKGGVTMPRILKEVDHLVLMPRCARHLLAGSTLGMKAAVGYWRTDTRLEYHRDAASLQEKTAEANTASILLEKQRLVLTTATKVLTTFGPDDGYVALPETGLIIASTSIVAHDMVSLAWLLENREATPDKDKRGMKDPYAIQAVVTNANRAVVAMLGGAAPAARTEKLVRNDLAMVGDDRVLTRAFKVLGGAPRLTLTDAHGTPEALRKRLEQMTAI